MKIILKYIFRSMIEKKMRFLLFIFSIAMSTALLLISLGIVTIQLDSIRRSVMDTMEEHDIMIASNTGETFFSIDQLELVGIESVIPSIVLPSVVQNLDFESVGLHARDSEELHRYHFVGSFDESMFANQSVIMSQRIALALNLDVNDTIEVVIAGDVVNFMIVGIVVNEGLFYQDQPHQFNLLIPYEWMSKWLGVENLYNTVTAKRALYNAEESIARFNDHHESYRAFLLYQEDIVMAGVRSQQMTYFLMLAFIMLVSCVILFGAYKLIITERQRVIGTFLSQGATKRQIKSLMLCEGLLYGFIGGLFGVVIGILALYGIHLLAAPLREYGVIPPFQFGMTQAFVALGFAVVFSIFACYVPTRHLNHFEVKELILDQSPSMPNLKKKNFFIGLSIIFVCLIVSSFFEEFAVLVSPILLVLSMIGLILIYPFVVSWLVRQLYPVLLPYLRVSALSLNNVRHSSSLRGNIAILMISLISVITVVSVSTGIERIVSEAYTTLHFDIRVDQIQINDPETRDSLLSYLENHPEVEQDSISEIIFIQGRVNDNFALFEAVDPDKFDKLLSYIDFSYNGGSYLEDLGDDQERYIIASVAASKRLNLLIGDSIQVEINGVYSEYIIIGIVEAKLWNGGDLFFFHKERMKEEFFVYNSILFFNTIGDSSEVVESFRTFFQNYGGTTVTHEEMKRLNTDQNRQTFQLLNYFSLFAVVVGSFGAINNMFISFLQRKKELAVMASLGATRNQINTMMMVESLFCVLIALGLVLLYVTLHMRLVSHVAKFIGFTVDLQFVFRDSALLLVASGIIYLLATIPLLLKSRSLSIIQELKHE